MMSNVKATDRNAFLAAHASNVTFMRDQARADGHFRVDLQFSGQSTGLYDRGSLERQWHDVVRPLCASASGIRLFARPEGMRVRLAAADRWAEFIKEAAEFLPAFTTSKPDGREEFEVLSERLLSEAGTEFWLWCLRAVEKAALRPVILLPNANSLGGEFFPKTTDPVVVKGFEEAIPKAAVQYARDHVTTGGIAVICVHARDTHELSVLGESKVIGGLYEEAMAKADFSQTFMAVLAAATDG